MKTDNRSQSITSCKNNILYIFSTPGLCVQDCCSKILHVFAEFCPVHAETPPTRGKPPQARFNTLFLFKSCSTFGQKIESATQHKCADPICKLHVICMLFVSSVNPLGSSQSLKRGADLILELSGPVRDTPPYRAIPFRDSIAEGGIACVFLVFIGYRASIAEIPL